MPVYVLEDGGKRFNVEAPDPESAVAAFRKMNAAPAQSGSPSAPADGANEYANVALGGMLEGVPVIGPALRGGADRIGAGVRSLLSGNSYEDELKFVQQATGQLKDRHPVVDAAAQAAGAVAGTAPLVAAAPAAFGIGAASRGSAALASGISGAAIGGADAGVRSGGDIGSTLLGAGVGGVVGAAAPEVSRLLGKGISALRKPGAEKAAIKAAPSLEGLREAAEAAYARADRAGVILRPEGIARVNKQIVEDLTEAGATPALQPRIFSALGELQKAEGQPITLKGMDVLRRVVSNAGASMDPTEKMLASKMISRIDDYLGAVAPKDAIMGNAREGIGALTQARALWRRIKKAEMIGEALGKAERAAASSGSGGNIDNAMRQKVRAILDNPKLSRGFTADEKAALERVVRGTKGQNALRLVGKLSPSGNGLMAALGVGATAANPLMAAAPVAGMVAKPLAERATGRSAALAEAIIRGGGKAPKAPPVNQAQIDEIVRVLLGGAQTQSTAPFVR